MVDFLAVLLTLVASFIQDGKPETLPPPDVSIRGSVVAEVVQTAPAAGAEGASGKTFAEVQDQVATSSQESPQPADTTKVAADNSKSGNTLPTEVPQVAVENSVALEEVTSETVTPDQNDGIQAFNTSVIDAEFGQQIAEPQPSTAQSEGKAFGQA